MIYFTRILFSHVERLERKEYFHVELPVTTENSIIINDEYVD